MGYLGINSNFLNRDIQIKRKTTEKDAYGGLTEAWSLLYDNIRGNIQETDNKQVTTETGDSVTRTHIAFLPSIGSDSRPLVISEGDRIFDENSNLLYLIVGVKRLAGRSGAIHHQQLELQALRQDPTRTQSYQISAKASIVSA